MSVSLIPNHSGRGEEETKLPSPLWTPCEARSKMKERYVLTDFQMDQHWWMEWENCWKFYNLFEDKLRYWNWKGSFYKVWKRKCKVFKNFKLQRKFMILILKEKVGSGKHTRERLVAPCYPLVSCLCNLGHFF